MGTFQPDEALYSLLCKYLLHEADATERQWVDAWLQEQPANGEVLGAVRRMLEASAPAASYPGIDTDRSWERLKAGILADQAGNEEKVVPMRRRFPWIRVAAILVLALGAAVWLWPRQPELPAVYTGGQKAELRDGSHIALGPKADLRLVGAFGKKERRVRFTGKGVFNIAQNPELPFVVELGQTEIKVLGTEFSVDYGLQTGLTVHVSSGKILVIDHQAGDSAILTQGMMLRRNEIKKDFSVAENIVDLPGKQLVFRNVPLHKVLSAIEAVYEVKVNVADPALLQREITANFENESVDNVMNAIAYMTNSQAVKDGAQQFSIK